MLFQSPKGGEETEETVVSGRRHRALLCGEWATWLDEASSQGLPQIPPLQSQDGDARARRDTSTKHPYRSAVFAQLFTAPTQKHSKWLPQACLASRWKSVVLTLSRMVTMMRINRGEQKGLILSSPYCDAMWRYIGPAHHSSPRLTQLGGHLGLTRPRSVLTPTLPIVLSETWQRHLPAATFHVWPPAKQRQSRRRMRSCGLTCEPGERWGVVRPTAREMRLLTTYETLPSRPGCAADVVGWLCQAPPGRLPPSSAHLCARDFVP